MRKIYNSSGIEVKSRENLHNIRQKLEKRLKSDTMKVDSLLHFRKTYNSLDVTSYAWFIENAAYLDMALNRRHWESADELASMLSAQMPYKDDLRCVRIIFTLLEEYDV